VAPHVNVAYQWNSQSLLTAMSPGHQRRPARRASYVLGADIGVEKRLSIAFDVLGRHSPDAPRLSSRTFTGADQTTYPDISFSVGSLNVVSGAIGMKANLAGTLLATFNLQFKLNDAGSGRE
jgi:hypothetical protein